MSWGFSNSPPKADPFIVSPARQTFQKLLLVQFSGFPFMSLVALVRLPAFIFMGRRNKEGEASNQGTTWTSKIFTLKKKLVA